MSDNRTVGAKFAEKVLVGAIEAIARAGAKFVESLASDTHKALSNEAAKVKAVKDGVEAWRQVRLGEVDDLPGSLRDEPKDHVQ
jgi:hypothetical protein